MTHTLPTWTPGPPPPIDGLAAAFRAADRRRARTAGMALVPVVALVAAVLTTTSMRPGGTDSLQLPPSQRGPVAPTVPQTALPDVGAQPTAPLPRPAGAP